MQFSEKVALLLAEKNLTYEKLARAVDVSISSVNKWLNGTKPHKRTAIRLANYFNLKLETLMDDALPLLADRLPSSEDAPPNLQESFLVRLRALEYKVADLQQEIDSLTAPSYTMVATNKHATGTPRPVNKNPYDDIDFGKILGKRKLSDVSDAELYQLFKSNFPRAFATLQNALIRNHNVHTRAWNAEKKHFNTNHKVLQRIFKLVSQRLKETV